MSWSTSCELLTSGGREGFQKKKYSPEHSTYQDDFHRRLWKHKGQSVGRLVFQMCAVAESPWVLVHTPHIFSSESFLRTLQEQHFSHRQHAQIMLKLVLR